MRMRYDLESGERHFAEAAPRYDAATRAMSLGRDAAWKRALVAALPDRAAPFCVDLACGTGDVAFLLADRYPGGRVVGVDIAEPMLAIARARNRRGNVSFARRDMGSLDFPDGCIDIVTGSYALRNARDVRAVLDETARVLVPGGAAAFLDFSKPASRPLQAAQRRVLGAWCGLWGLILHGNPEVHGGYIARSLDAFPDRARLLAVARERGLLPVASRRFFLGITEMIVLRKE